jgi:hypothetical protein
VIQINIFKLSDRNPGLSNKVQLLIGYLLFFFVLPSVSLASEISWDKEITTITEPEDIYISPSRPLSPSPSLQAQIQPPILPAPTEELPTEKLPAETPEAPEIKDSDRESLAQTILFLQGLQALELRPQQSEQIAKLLSELRQLQAQNLAQIELSAEQTQTIKTLVDSIAPEEWNLLTLYFLAKSPPADLRLNLTQQSIEGFLKIAKQLEASELVPNKKEQLQQFVTLLQQLQAQNQPTVELSQEQTKQFFAAIDTLIFPDRPSVAETIPGRSVTAEELKNTILFLQAARKFSLPPEQKSSIETLLTTLEQKSPQEDGQILITSEEDFQLASITNALSERQISKIRQKVFIANGGSLVNPAVSVLTPIGFGGTFGNVSLGLAYQKEVRFNRKQDASFSTSFSIGDPQKNASLTITPTVYSLTNRGSGAFSAGAVSFQLSRALPDDFSIALGVENLITWPNDTRGSNDAGTNTYLVLSKLIKLREDPFAPLGVGYISAGLGNGRFRPPKKFDRDDNGFDFYPFGSASVQLLPRVNGIAEWTGQDVSLGLSLVPFRKFPAAVTFAVVDLFGNAEEDFGREGKPRFTAFASYVIFF